MIAYLLLVFAAALDIAANMLMEKSDGFKYKKYGVPALFMICLAFTLLAQVTKVMDLAVAYVSWGGIAILGTVLCGWYFLGQKLNWKGWMGIAMIFSSILLLKTA